MAEQVEFKWVVDESDVIRAAENLTAVKPSKEK